MIALDVPGGVQWWQPEGYKGQRMDVFDKPAVTESQQQIWTNSYDTPSRRRPMRWFWFKKKENKWIDVLCLCYNLRCVKFLSVLFFKSQLCSKRASNTYPSLLWNELIAALSCYLRREPVLTNPSKIAHSSRLAWTLTRECLKQTHYNIL